MDDSLPFASKTWFVMLGLLLFGRGMDFLSTWVATPNLVLEGNPIAKKLGWKWGIPLNLFICFSVAFWPVSAIVITTTSVLVAARNFQSAWMMRSMGEEFYRDWYVTRMQQAPLSLYLFCLFGQTLLTALVGAAVFYFGQRSDVLAAIGIGIIAYAAAVLIFTLIAVWRTRWAMRSHSE